LNSFFAYSCRFAVCSVLLGGLLGAGAAEFGPLWHDFPLTLDPGHRTEALGPLWYEQESDSQATRAIPPVFSTTADPDLEYREDDFLYPLLTYDRFGGQYRWQLFQLLSFAGGPTQTETNRDRFTIFPIYFQQRSSDPEETYTALVPFYGHLQHRFSRDEVDFILWPGYVKTRKKDVVTRNYLLPVFHLREGNKLEGWQVWPLAGHEQKQVTWATNSFGDRSIVGGHDRWFALWPIYFRQDNEIGTTNAGTVRMVLPAYVGVRSPQRDSTTILWPFFSRIDDRAREYKEWHAPWPFIAFADGKGKQMVRVLPFYSHATGQGMETRSYGWLLYRENGFKNEALERKRVRVLFFLYSDLFEKNMETGAHRRRVDFWPLFTSRRDLNGNERLQVLAVLEPLLANNKSIERNYSPLWSLWRQENNPRAGASSQSLLWNLYRHETRPDYKKTSLLFGLFRYVNSGEGKQVRLFYIPFGKKPSASQSEGKGTGNPDGPGS